MGHSTGDEKRDRSNWCEAPSGPFRPIEYVPFFVTAPVIVVNNDAASPFSPFSFHSTVGISLFSYTVASLLILAAHRRLGSKNLPLCV